MSFLKRLFKSQPKEYVDERGIYFNIECGRCKSRLRPRADRQYDLNSSDNGYTWRKTIVCSECFHKMSTEVLFDSKYKQISQDIDGGRYLTDEQVVALESAEKQAALEAAAAAEAAAEENEESA